MRLLTADYLRRRLCILLIRAAGATHGAEFSKAFRFMFDKYAQAKLEEIQERIAEAEIMVNADPFEHMTLEMDHDEEGNLIFRPTGEQTLH